MLGNKVTLLSCCPVRMHSIVSGVGSEGTFALRWCNSGIVGILADNKYYTGPKEAALPGLGLVQ